MSMRQQEALAVKEDRAGQEVLRAVELARRRVEIKRAIRVHLDDLLGTRLPLDHLNLKELIEMLRVISERVKVG